MLSDTVKFLSLHFQQNYTDSSSIFKGKPGCRTGWSWCCSGSPNLLPAQFSKKLHSSCWSCLKSLGLCKRPWVVPVFILGSQVPQRYIWWSKMWSARSWSPSPMPILVWPLSQFLWQKSRRKVEHFHLSPSKAECFPLEEYIMNSIYMCIYMHLCKCVCVYISH